MRERRQVSQALDLTTPQESPEHGASRTAAKQSLWGHRGSAQTQELTRGCLNLSTEYYFRILLKKNCQQIEIISLRY